LVRALLVLELRTPHRDLDGDVLVLGHEAVSRLNVLIPNRQNVRVRHRGELLSTELEVGLGDVRIGVLDHGIVTVACDADLVRGGERRATRSRHEQAVLQSRRDGKMLARQTGWVENPRSARVPTDCNTPC